ncbi:hypothetical protein [Parafrankia discariae]|uniref:hypothetical protein n=1 Tax=Parafrankia discariae TaxID=365528 RepID=UPI00047845B0|nr:hypothetical protein [Parafrankia discariae]
MSASSSLSRSIPAYGPGLYPVQRQAGANEGSFGAHAEYLIVDVYRYVESGQKLGSVVVTVLPPD